MRKNPTRLIVDDMVYNIEFEWGNPLSDGTKTCTGYLLKSNRRVAGPFKGSSEFDVAVKIKQYIKTPAEQKIPVAATF